MMLMANIYIYDATSTDEQQLSVMLADNGHNLHFTKEPLSLDNVANEAEVIAVFVTSTVSRELLERMPHLRLIACRSTGFNTIDMQAADEHHITVTNVPTYGEHTVAEYAFMLTLALSRKLIAAQEALDKPEFDPATLTGFDLTGKTFGIIGAGRIGQHSARIARGFDMRVLAFDPYPNQDRANEIGFEYTELYRLLTESDVVSLHAPYTPENHHTINAERLAKMKSTALLINTARGELVDTGALLEALQQHKLAGAALDVAEGEKLLHVDEEILLLRSERIPKEQLQFGMELSILQKMPTVIITPHNAFNTTEAIERINRTVADNIHDFWEGRIPNKVTPPPKPKGKLIIIRHGESEWNAQGRWTGSRDRHLSEKGFHEAALLGQAVQDIHFDYAFSSQQIRAFETLEGILDTIQQFDVPYERSATINERDYGDYTGKNKWEMRDLIGQEAFDKIRRNWDEPVPHGETLKMVYERAIPFYQQVILPRVTSGQNVMVVSHGNAIRALMKYIENVSDEGITRIEMPFGNVLIYEVDENGRMTDKVERHIATAPPPV
jgi:D-lactate dehydrogenase